MRRTKLFLSAIVLFAVCLTGWTIVNNQKQREDDNFSKNVEALTLPAENPDGTPPCNNKNGFKQWSINGGLLQHKKNFYDCCYKLREGYSPEGACEE